MVYTSQGVDFVCVVFVDHCSLTSVYIKNISLVFEHHKCSVAYVFTIELCKQLFLFILKNKYCHFSIRKIREIRIIPSITTYNYVVEVT